MLALKIAPPYSEADEEKVYLDPAARTAQYNGAWGFGPAAAAAAVRSASCPPLEGGDPCGPL